MSPLDDALAKIREVDGDFATLVESMYERRWTGYTGLHWLNGIPSMIDLPGVRVKLARRVSREKVDEREKVVHASSV